MLIKKSVLWIFFIMFSAPFFAMAANDVTISDDTNFEINTSDTAVLTAIVADAGGQATNLDVESNYIDITLDNASNLTFNVSTANRYLKITKQSGSNDYTISPSCPTTSVILSGTGATVILRLQVQTTNPCVSGGGGGGGGSSGGYIPPAVIPSSTPTTETVCPQGDIYSTTTGQLCTSWLTSTPIVPPIVSPQTCLPYLTKFIKLGATNDPVEVNKLQTFLRDYEGEINLVVTGIYDTATFNAVKRFQAKYASDVLAPWGLYNPTGWVYRTTIFKINEIYCERVKGCGPYLTSYIKYGAANDASQVLKLQSFLKTYEGEALIPQTGIYDLASFNAVKRFQSKYIQDILIPWGLYAPTGYVFRTTKFKINELYCAKGNYASLPTTVELPILAH